MTKVSAGFSGRAVDGSFFPTPDPQEHVGEDAGNTALIHQTHLLARPPRMASCSFAIKWSVCGSSKLLQWRDPKHLARAWSNTTSENWHFSITRNTLEGMCNKELAAQPLGRKTWSCWIPGAPGRARSPKAVEKPHAMLVPPCTRSSSRPAFRSLQLSPKPLPALAYHPPNTLLLLGQLLSPPSVSRRATKQKEPV